MNPVEVLAETVDVEGKPRKVISKFHQFRRKVKNKVKERGRKAYTFPFGYR